MAARPEIAANPVSPEVMLCSSVKHKNKILLLRAIATDAVIMGEIARLVLEEVNTKLI